MYMSHWILAIHLDKYSLKYMYMHGFLSSERFPYEIDKTDKQKNLYEKHIVHVDTGPGV